MDRKAWKEVAAAVATVITALVGSVALLGEHAAGTVLGLIIAIAFVFLYIAREKQIEQERAACHECRKEHAAAIRERWGVFITDKEETNDALRAIEVNIATLSRGNAISAALTSLAQRMDRQEAAAIADNQSASVANVAAIERDTAMGGRVDALKTRMNGKDEANHVRKGTKGTRGSTG